MQIFLIILKKMEKKPTIIKFICYMTIQTDQEVNFL